MKSQKLENNVLKVEGISSKGYGIIQKLVMQDRNLTRDAKCIYAYLRSFAGAGSTAFPSIIKICDDLCFGSEDTFYLHLNHLKAYGYVVVTRRYSENGKIQTNVYNLPENPVPNPEYLDKINNFKSKEKDRNDKKRDKKAIPLVTGDIPGYQGTGNRDTGNQGTGNQGTNNNNEINNKKEISTTEKNNTHRQQEPVCADFSPNINISKTLIADCSDPILAKVAFRNLQQENKNDTHRDNKKHMCEASIRYLKISIKTITGFDISEKKVKELLVSSSLERIQYHLSNWNIHKQNQKKQGAGYFITVTENDIEPIEPRKQTYNQNKIPQRDNFDQRKYSDEELESFYANLED